MDIFFTVVGSSYIFDLFLPLLALAALIFKKEYRWVYTIKKVALFSFFGIVLILTCFFTTTLYVWEYASSPFQDGFSANLIYLPYTVLGVSLYLIFKRKYIASFLTYKCTQIGFLIIISLLGNAQ